MINISKNSLVSYPEIGSGKYGTVYQIDDETAYKIYHTYIIDKQGDEIINPALFMPTYKIKSLLRRRKKLQYTDLIKDYIIIDGYFGGVCIPYYDGSTLEQLKNIPYQVKKDISTQLVRNHQELRKNLIYPMDYHLGNVIYNNGNTKIIDLDDPLTRVDYFPDLFSLLISTGRLNETIQDLFEENKLYYNSKRIKELLGRQNSPYSNKSDWLSTFIEKKEEIKDYLLIDEQSNLDEIKSLIRDKQYRILYLFDETLCNEDYLINKILFYKNNNIPIYDLLEIHSINSYFNNFPTREKVLVRENQNQLLTN